MKLLLTVIIVWVGIHFVLSTASAQPATEVPVATFVGTQDTISAEDLNFFERRVRPILVDSCYECHSTEARRVRGGLLLDSANGWRIGGDSGPALLPGDPDNSRLILAIRYKDPDSAMPPKDKLSASQIADLTEWVQRGAPDPRVLTTRPRVGESEEGQSDIVGKAQQHWAYQPPVRGSLPAVHNEEWIRRDVDRFILAGLESVGLDPAPPADRATLVRRMYHDLTGLAPTTEEWARAMSDIGPDAMERLVDELLSSPHFGEHWGRHWLDVVRFAESLTLRGFILPEAWRYRDYVIQAFNEDLSFQDFIRDQIAGDLLDTEQTMGSNTAGPAEDQVANGATWEGHFQETEMREAEDAEEARLIYWRQQRRIATSFLMLGNINLEDQDKKQLDMDIVDEQLDTLGKAFLAQTISCARCHDHKFDPIPTRDYYALAGILASCQSVEHANVSKWLEFPLPVTRKEQIELDAQQERLDELQSFLKVAREKRDGLTAKSGQSTGSALAVKDVSGVVIDDTEAQAVGDWMVSQHTGRFIGTGYRHDKNDGKGKKTLTFHPKLPKSGRYEVRLAYIPGENRARQTPVTVLHADGETTIRINQRMAPPIDGRFVSLGEFQFERGNQGYVLVSNLETDGHVIADAIQFLSLETDAEEGAQLAARVNQEADEEAQRIQAELDEVNREVTRLETALRQVREEGPVRPMYLSVKETGKPVDLPVHVRGSVHQLGEIVPRGFLQAISQAGERASSPLPDDGSGRKELAEWLVDPANPLTARVAVNRVWHWLFGVGLVRTTDNFGTTGQDPTHPELLDYLAVRFMEEGWSVKTLLRELVLSNTYQQETLVDPDRIRADPENQWWGRMLRRRLGAESLRDRMLQLSGQLDRQLGGPNRSSNLSSDYAYQHKGQRRSVYTPVFRNSLPDIFQVFDFADPSLVTGARNATTVAPQALFLMNHPFVIEQSRTAADTLLAAPLSAEERVDWLYQQALGRQPSEGELAVVLSVVLSENFIGEEGVSRERETWAQVVQAVIASPDFRYID